MMPAYRHDHHRLHGSHLFTIFSLLIQSILFSSHLIAEAWITPPPSLPNVSTNSGDSRPETTTSLSKHRIIRVCNAATTTGNDIGNTNNDLKDNTDGGIYGPFARYAWDVLVSNGLGSSSSLVPSELASNDAPAKGSDDLRVNIEVKALANDRLDETSGNGINRAVRLARYALLHTTSQKSLTLQTNAIHVLNLVIFPAMTVPEPVPVFGADLVTLPGNKHLIVIDFQPILKQPNDDNDNTEEIDGILTLPDDDLFDRLKDIHQKHVLQNIDCMPWGGDIPAHAKRFFSPYALWTRLTNEDAVDIVRTKVLDAFKDYLDLYVDVLKVAAAGEVSSESEKMKIDDDVMEGHEAYLEYRRKNDPARPMLKSLYGEEWTEKLINDILFKPL